MASPEGMMKAVQLEDGKLSLLTKPIPDIVNPKHVRIQVTHTGKKETRKREGKGKKRGGHFYQISVNLCLCVSGGTGGSLAVEIQRFVMSDFPSINCA